MAARPVRRWCGHNTVAAMQVIHVLKILVIELYVRIQVIQ